MLYFILGLFFLHKIEAVTLDIGGSIDLGPKWKYEYEINAITNTIANTENPKDEEFSIKADRKSYMGSLAFAVGKKVMSILRSNPFPIQLRDVRYDKARVSGKPNATTSDESISSNETIKSYLRELDTKKNNWKENVTIRVELETSNRTSKATTKNVPKKRMRLSKDRGNNVFMRYNYGKTTKNVETTTSESSSIEYETELDKELTPIKREMTTIEPEEIRTQTPKKTTKAIKIEPRYDVDIFVDPVRVKDDPALTEHIQHIYKQSLKVFDDLKKKVDDGKLKKEIKFLARSYDEKFKEFVKENKYLKIRSRVGKKKVILNAAEFSNKVLDRLIGFLKAKVETRSLRSNVPNVFENELNKKKELENQRICKKFGICRSGKTFRHFLIDALTIILNSDDGKVRQVTDAMTEVIKGRNFSNIVVGDAKNKIRRGIRDFESYSIGYLRAIYFIMRNVLVNINEPLKVTDNDKTVNKTVAFIELIDILEEKMHPDEVNRLTWADMINSLKAWSRNERHDITDIAETFVDNAKYTIDDLDIKSAHQIQRDINIITGYNNVLFSTTIAPIAREYCGKK